MTKKLYKKQYKYTKKLYKEKNKNKKNYKKQKYTLKKIIGGGPKEQLFKNINNFRREFVRTINSIIIQKSNNKQKEKINVLLELFEKDKQLINTLIPITNDDNPIYKVNNKDDPNVLYYEHSVLDYVSPVIIIFNKLTDKIQDAQLIRILNVYYNLGGNFNLPSSKYRITPLKYEIKKRRTANIDILLDKNNRFNLDYNDILEHRRQQEQRRLEERRLEEEQRRLEQEQRRVIEQEHRRLEEEQRRMLEEHDRALELRYYNNNNLQLLQLPFALPDNGCYITNASPEFWTPIFNDLINIRQSLHQIYNKDKYNEELIKPIQICQILERLIPGYFTKTFLDYRETPTQLTNTNILNCIITLLCGIISNRLFETSQDYLIIIKGGRAIQLATRNIKLPNKYFSGDTDILIVPNISKNIPYDEDKMSNLSSHISYLIKWFIPEDLNIVIELPATSNKKITKLAYKINITEEKAIYKPLIDVGFDDLPEKIKIYFENTETFKFNIQELNNTEALFTCPNINDILYEKMYYFIKYIILKRELLQQPVTEIRDKQISECDYYHFKFQRATSYLLVAIYSKNFNTNVVNIANYNEIMEEALTHMDDYTEEEKEYARTFIRNLFPIEASIKRSTITVKYKQPLNK